MSVSSIPFGKLFINGQWSDPDSASFTDIYDPSTGQVIGSVGAANAADVDRAVEAARAAFSVGPWSRTGNRDRAQALNAIADLIRANADELATIESLDVGKPLEFCRRFDVEVTARTYDYYAALAYADEGSVRHTPAQVLAYVNREPLGVVGAITPFNFPLVLSTSKIAPALAAGNTVVHKPGDETPLSALYIAALMQKAGLPDGVVNVVTGSGADAGDALLRHSGLDKVAFTGSTRIGRHAATLAGELLRPVTVELGGNAANIVFADADLGRAVDTVIKAFTTNTGQFCMGGPRLLVEASIHDEFVKELSVAVSYLPVGDPRDPATRVGPMAAMRHLEKVEEYVKIAIDEGGHIATGGHRVDHGGGYFYAPTVITGLANTSPVVQEEIFGPVLTVQPFHTEEEAITLANSTPYGLAAGLQTSNLARAHTVAARLQAGIIWVNDWVVMDPAVPFGGVKLSGFGREYGKEALEAYSRTKSVITSLER